MRTYMGVDLHYKQITYHSIMRADDGAITRKNGTIPTDQLLERFIPMLCKDTYICVEATGSTYAFIEKIEGYTGEIFVVNPQDFKEISCSGKKTDKIDAKKLATRLKMHVEDGDPDDGFPAVYIPDKQTQQLRGLFSTYEFINKEIVAVKNRISSFFRSRLLPTPNFNKSYNIVEFAGKSELVNIELFQLKILSEELSRLELYKTEIKHEIAVLGWKRFTDDIKLLLTIPGINIFTACAIMADVADIRRFKNYKKFASYLRSAPRVYSSDSVIHNGKIDKKGRKLSFKYMVQGLTHFRKTNPILEDFYERKSNGKSKGKVRAAIVRKMIVIIYFMLKNNESYKFCNDELYMSKMKAIDKKSQAAA